MRLIIITLPSLKNKTMANRITNSFIDKIRKYLKDNDLPFINVNNSKNIMVLRSAGSYHYLVIQFFDMPELWMHQRRHFKIKTAYAIDYNQLTNAIDRYLDA
jgi:hypothetical protein